MKECKVAETFVSINGEGPRSGQLAYFIRLAGCGLSCAYCDTAWASGQDGVDESVFRMMTVQQLCDEVRLSGITNVTLTGGEPLEQECAGELIEALLADGRIDVEIETNGSIDIAPFIPDDGRRRPVFTMDYKLPSSGMEIMMRAGNFDLLNGEDTVKFVVSDRADLERAMTVIDAYELTERCRVTLSPVFGAIEPETIIDFMKENRVNRVGLQLQLHKIIWGPETRGV